MPAADTPAWVIPLISAAGVVVAAAISAAISLAAVRATRRGQDVSARTAAQQSDLDALRESSDASAENARVAMDLAKAAATDAAEARKETGEMRVELDHVREESAAALRVALGVIERIMRIIRWYRSGAIPPPIDSEDADVAEAEALLARAMRERRPRDAPRAP